jgi:hypothetical protein
MQANVAGPMLVQVVDAKSKQARCTPSFVLPSSLEDMFARVDVMQRLDGGLGRRLFPQRV